MSLKVIFEIPPGLGGYAFEHVYRRCRLDYTDLLELTLRNWEEIMGDIRLLQVELEGEVFSRWSRKQQAIDYPALMETTAYLTTVLSSFYEAMSPTLSAFMGGKGLPSNHMELELIGWSGRDPIVCIKRKPMPVLHLNEQEV